MLKILIVEDELIIAEDLKNMLIHMQYDVIGIAIDHKETLQLIKSKKPDLILLDINLNCSVDGIEIAHIINNTYKIPFIYTTSYADAATLERAKETIPLNYIVKPFNEQQLFSTIELSLDTYSLQGKSQPNESKGDTLIIKETIFLKNKYNYSRLDIKDILWLKSDGNYLEIYLHERKELVRATLTSFLENLTDDFIRTHKSYAINLNFLSNVEASFVEVMGSKIPLSKTYRAQLLERLKIV